MPPWGMRKGSCNLAFGVLGAPPGGGCGNVGPAVPSMAQAVRAGGHKSLLSPLNSGPCEIG